jgi:hypothetical protein
MIESNETPENAIRFANSWRKPHRRGRAYRIICLEPSIEQGQISPKVDDWLFKEHFGIDICESNRLAGWFFTLPTKSMRAGVGRSVEDLLTKGTRLIVIGSSLTSSRSAVLALSRTATRSFEYHE